MMVVVYPHVKDPDWEVSNTNRGTGDANGNYILIQAESDSFGSGGTRRVRVVINGTEVQNNNKSTSWIVQF